MSGLRSIVKRTLPTPLFRWAKSVRDARRRKILSAVDSRADIFSAIYRERMWGGGEADFYSGRGSHEEAIVGPYVEAVRSFLGTLPAPPNACDFGCGDFSVGSQVRSLCAGYVACDVVPELIARNREVYKNTGTEFRALDMVADELPDGDVVFIRQVFQHLSNDEIKQVLPKLRKFKAVIVTEDVPLGEFEPNHDKPTGFDVRLSSRSGVNLSAPPFDFPAKAEREICFVQLQDFGLRTVLYEPA